MGWNPMNREEGKGAEPMGAGSRDKANDYLWH